MKEPTVLFIYDLLVENRRGLVSSQTAHATYLVKVLERVPRVKLGIAGSSKEAIMGKARALPKEAAQFDLHSIHQLPLISTRVSK